MPSEQFQATWLAIVKGSVGITSKRTTEYDDIISPGETGGMARSLRSIYPCAMFIRAALRLLGVSHPELAAPYVIGAAFANLERVFGVYREASESMATGAVFMIGRGLSTHVGVMVGRTAERPSILTTVEAQTVAGHNVIRERHREYNTSGGLPYLGPDDDGLGGTRELTRWYSPLDVRHLCTLQWRMPWVAGRKIAAQEP